eukprot:symbB.v1.2.029771.t1/scaffold3294.1/size59574/12
MAIGVFVLKVVVPRLNERQLVVGETMIGETTIAAGTMIAGETIAVDGTTTASGEMMIVADAMMTDALILSRGIVQHEQLGGRSPSCTPSTRAR